MFEANTDVNISQFKQSSNDISAIMDFLDIAHNIKNIFDDNELIF